MIRALVLALTSLGLTGCGTHLVSHTRVEPITLASNVQGYDRYVEQRTASLLAMGAFTDRSKAEAKAQQEAANRYGPRAAEVTTTWTTRRAPSVNTAILDQMAQRR
jgi:outer membrane lipopolysaccharide assembly protein LptE/RlpB